MTLTQTCRPTDQTQHPNMSMQNYSCLTITKMLRKLDVHTYNKINPKSTTQAKLTPDDHRPQLRLPEETWQV